MPKLMLLAHAPIAYISNELIQKNRIAKLKLYEQMIVLLFAVFFGILPDFDIFTSPIFLHHDLITHTPIFYIGIWIVMRILLKPISKLLNKKTSNIFHPELLSILANTFLIATLSHLVADVVTSSVMLLYPFSQTHFYLLKEILEPNLFAGYFLNPMFALELIFVGIFLYLILKKYFLSNSLGRTLQYISLCLPSIFLLTTVLIFFNTYNSSYLRDQEGNINYDVDFDLLTDKSDYDVGNNGRDNIMDINPTELNNSVLEIINSNKWSGNNSGTISQKLRYKLGGIDSYRLVSQVYYNLHSPIEPALLDFNIKKNGSNSYDITGTNYSNLLLLYYQSKNALVELNLEGTPNLTLGRTLFLLDEKGELLNLGITLEGNYVAIAFEDDQNLTMHSYDSIKEKYEGKLKGIWIVN